MKVFQSVFFTFWAFSFTNWQLTVEVLKKLRYNFPPPRRKLNPDLWHIRLLCYNYTNLICESEKIFSAANLEQNSSACVLKHEQ